MDFQNNTQHQYFIRAMEELDISQVHEIDQLSFALPWPVLSFVYELKENPNSLLWVAVKENGQSLPQIILGFIVVWLIIDEAHIATIAVRPEFRGQGVAVQLMNTAIQEIVHRGITRATLEVRTSNLPAQNLYDRYGFVTTGIRPKYYKDNNEDAMIMTADNLDKHNLPGKMDRMFELVERKSGLGKPFYHESKEVL